MGMWKRMLRFGFLLALIGPCLPADKTWEVRKPGIGCGWPQPHPPGTPDG